MPIKQTPLTFAKSTATVRKQKITALPLDINRSTEIIGHSITYFVIFYTTLNYLYYKSIQDDEDKD